MNISMSTPNLTVGATTSVVRAPAPIPFGCICSYTWAPFRPGVVRNGPLMSCVADHSEVDAG